MAAGGLRGRLGRLEVRVQDVGIARIARRRTGDGVSAADAEGELRRFLRLVRLRLGPYPDHRALGELLAEEYGAAAATAYREARARRRTGR